MNDFFLADDLSGALDAAAAFHQADHRVKVALTLAAWSAAGADEVVGFTTETRNAPAVGAAGSVAAAIEHGLSRGGRLLYKKIDSTLRGPVAAELAAVLAALPHVRILFCPANPRVGRTVSGGVLLVNGVPVAETEFARDPVSPVRQSTIRELLGDAATDRVVIADAGTEQDLAGAVAGMDAAGSDWVAVGSGALARAVALRSGMREAARNLLPPVFPPGPTLMVCGSAHRANRLQADELQRTRGVPVCELRLDRIADAVHAVKSNINLHGTASLLVEHSRGESGAVLRAIAGVAAEVIIESGIRRIFITGGETAFAICGALGISAFTFLREVEAGVSLSLAEARGVEVRVAVKPGGFGDAATWMRVWDQLQTEH